jgi:hypothetical protein
VAHIANLRAECAELAGARVYDAFGFLVPEVARLNLDDLTACYASLRDALRQAAENGGALDARAMRDAFRRGAEVSDEVVRF